MKMSQELKKNTNFMGVTINPKGPENLINGSKGACSSKSNNIGYCRICGSNRIQIEHGNV